MILKIKNIIKNNSILHEIYKKLHNLKTKKIENDTVKRLNDIEKLSNKEIEDLQKSMLLNILEYSYKNTNYYKKLFDENNINYKDIEDLKRIPFLDKSIIKVNKSDLISKEFDISELGVKNTGGSTGEPLVFYCNTKAGLIDLGHHAYLYKLMGHKKNDIILSCGGFNIPDNLIKSNIFWLKMESGDLFGDYKFSVLYLNNSNIKLYVDKLLEIKPNILRGYPSFFYTLGKYILENNINLNFQIKGINLTSEMCSLEQRILIEKAFSSMVYFEYGHTEVSLYCYTNDNTYSYKSSPIYGYIEVLDDQGNETKVGKVGNIITTGFNNVGMPFIRYKTGDLGEVAYRNGGVIHFKSIFGRTQDYILTKDNDKVYLTALIFGQHLKAFSNIYKWQIIQNQTGVIDINIIKGNEYSISDEVEIREKITEVTDIEINFMYVNNIPKTKRGKHLFLIQRIKN
ncbi:phenylacetate--CoA ligase family protein [Cellulophaga sp. E16_2]|uniref:phenylacetate--CoA ligase family protein n=1 Tax=Cellulophaga sp. E16_2 TaxID=2789297 RepID=UPI001A91977D|nr:phenylacetate--CoA ligase family protein [Cellulophaga sp. E16_2]MBO0592818.1 phenylacetate--CoA ligase family protein [Cellulophaga sp. E16_2]